MTPKGPIRMLRRPMNPLFRPVCRAFGVTSPSVALAGPSRPRTPSSSPVERKSGLNSSWAPSPPPRRTNSCDPDVAFQLSADADGPDRVRIQWAIHEGYYLYKSRVKVATTSTQVSSARPRCPPGEKKTDEYFGEQEVYHDEVVATVPVSRPPGGAVELPLDVTYQGCADAGLCYPPITKTLNVSLPAPARGGSYESSTRGPARRADPPQTATCCDRARHVLRSACGCRSRRACCR